MHKHNGTYDLLSDFNHDGVVDSTDYVAFASLYTAGENLGRGNLSRSTTDNRIGYAGYRWDRFISKYHVRNRVYEPATGRWLNRDPIEYDAGTMNLYEYCGSYPQRYVDPQGLDIGTGWPREEWHSRTPRKPSPTFKKPPKSVPEALLQGAVEGFFCWCEGFSETLFLGLVDIDVSPYLYDPSDPSLDISRKMGMVSCVALEGAVGCKASGFNAKCAVHPPHAGGPHQFWHLQINWWRRGVKGSGGVFRYPWWMSR
ncbi:MAG: RHS repeat-associated core domain-containing protein [Phycisphaeraceae bacterium]|nr:RHS repeat-associated core domain-containing protein [Phycisphaeraceae bacterium]